MSIFETTRFFVFGLIVVAYSASLGAADDGESGAWQQLFDGKTLGGWVQRNGKAKYNVENGAIVGTTAVDSPNSFLCTEDEFGDFVLEVDFKVDEKLNSGVQIRSESRKDYQNGRVHGYQVEIDPGQEPWTREPANRLADGTPAPAGEPRCWTGGIYDEARRGWLQTLAENEPARKAFKPGKWNQLRIKAEGDRIRTWVNGVPAADLEDSATPRGFIALQVHSTTSKKPLQVRWKNIRLKNLDAANAVSGEQTR